MAPVSQKQKNNINTVLNDNFNLIIVFAVLIFLVAGYFLIIRPKFEATISTIKESISQQEQFYLNQKQKLEDLKAAAALYRSINPDDVKKVNAILPNEYAKEKLFGELEDIFARQGLVLDDIQIVKVGEVSQSEPMAANDKRVLDIPNAERVGIVQVELSVSSVDYATLKNLLPLLESHLQLIDIKRLDFDPEGDIATISFSTYYFH